MENLNTSSLFSLKNKVIAITGGYGYLGSAISEGISKAGAKTIVLGRSKSKFDEAFDPNINIYFEPCDVSSTESINSALSNIITNHGKIDVLINNAFYAKGGDVYQMPDDAWDTTIDGTLSSVHRCMRAIIPYFREQKSGRVINVASMYGVIAPDFDVYKDNPEYINPPHYGAGKAGVVQLSKYYASLLGKENILVNSVSPGPFPSTDVQESKIFVEALSKKNCLRRIGSPEELIGVFVFLSSLASTFITGQNISVDGGWTVN